MANLTTNLFFIKQNHNSRNLSYKLQCKLGKDYQKYKEINLLTILDTLGINDFFLALHAAKQTKSAKVVAITLAVLFAESILPIFEKSYPKNNIPRKSIQITKDFFKGNKERKDVEKAWVTAAAVGKEIASFSPAWFAISAIEQAIWTVRWHYLKNPAEIVKKVSNMALKAALYSGETDWAMQKQAQIKIIQSTLERR